MLAATRTRRPNAGNRMQALLAAQEALQEEEVFGEVVGDGEFEAAADEADIFGSDFASTDSEPETTNPAVTIQTDASLRAEELASRPKRKFHDPLAATRRSAKSKSTTTPNPNPIPGSRVPASHPRTKRPRPTPTLSNLPLQHREVRSSTITAKIETHARLATARALKRPAPPRRADVVALSQSDRIEMALELEGTNSRELGDWLEREEERRRCGLVRRQGVRGERVMWVSRAVGAGTTRYERNLLNLFDVKPEDEHDVILGSHATHISKAPSAPTKCPLTGLPARYRCPRTGIPYANLSAYRAINHLTTTADAGAEPDWRWSAHRGAWLGGPTAWDGKGDVDDEW